MSQADSVCPTASPPSDRDWEALWAPYDESVYETALGMLETHDVALDLGAGDLRFTRRAASRVRRIIAVERNPEILRFGLETGGPVPENLTTARADAREWSFPKDITVGVLLMRHCRHLREYITRLREVGCRRLITNARWGMDVECIPLTQQPSFAQARNGWYGCLCGAVGFKAVTIEEIDAASLNVLSSVEDCPACNPAAVLPLAIA